MGGRWALGSGLWALGSGLGLGLWAGAFLGLNGLLNWKAFFKLYKIITPLHRSDLKIQQNFADVFLYFSRFNFCKFLKSDFFSPKSHRFFADFNENFPEFRSISRNFMKTAIDTRDLLNF